MTLRPGSLVPHDLPPTAIPDGTGMFALVISLGDIQGQCVDRLATFVEQQLSTVESAQRIVGKCRLTVDGYNDDPRDLTQIPEVRSYFQRVAVECPLLAFLCEPVRDEMLLYLALVGDGRRVPVEGEVPHDPLLSSAKHTSYSRTDKLNSAGLAYAAALGQWLSEKGLLEQEGHPLWKAHESSLACMLETFQSMGSRLKPVP